jgi:hypothetical protein
MTPGPNVRVESPSLHLGSSGDEGPRRGHRTGARVPPHRRNGNGHHRGETARRGPRFLLARIPDLRPTICVRPGLIEPAGPGERRPRQPAVEGLCHPSSAWKRRGRRAPGPSWPADSRRPTRGTLCIMRNELGRGGADPAAPPARGGRVLRNLEKIWENYLSARSRVTSQFGQKMSMGTLGKLQIWYILTGKAIGVIWGFGDGDSYDARTRFPFRSCGPPNAQHLASPSPHVWSRWRGLPPCPRFSR